MKVYYDQGRVNTVVRLHPYKAGAEDQSGYIDFKAEPSLIPQVLEDFKAFNHWNSVQKFYEVLCEINGQNSFLETCDCAFRGPSTHTDNNSDLELVVHGRLFVLFRNLQLNCSQDHIEWLCGRLQTVLTHIEPEMKVSEGVVGFSLCSALHTELSDGNWLEDGSFYCDDDDPGYGQHLKLSFWAYGDNDAMVDKNLFRVFGTIGEGCRSISEEIATTLNLNQ